MSADPQLWLRVGDAFMRAVFVLFLTGLAWRLVPLAVAAVRVVL